MLFTTQQFMIFFLPACLAVHVLLRPLPRLQLVWLLLASILFYGWNNPDLVYLLLVSMLVNFGASQAIVRHRFSAPRLAWAVAGLVCAADLAALGYFKYWNFFWSNAAPVLGADFSRDIALPLAISFFTFQQIAYVVDCARGAIAERDFVKYGLFVTFFPHLIAGPLVHHAEMIPQFGRVRSARQRHRDYAVGISIFAMGLAKKVVFADWFAGVGDLGFHRTATVAPSFVEGWSLALVFALQIYFDFSGYSDMAVGLARMFGIRLPENFNSPYKAASIIDFWRRWHITLSRFFRDYLYIPLGGGERGRGRHLRNLAIVMLLAGLWHGAGWGFVLWGAAHGLMLMINHGLHWIWPPPQAPGHVRRLGGVLATFLLVVFAWVPFRVPDLAATGRFWQAMLLGDGIGLPVTLRPLLGEGAALLERAGFHFSGLFPSSALGSEPGMALAAIIAGLAWVWLLPNTAAMVGRHAPLIGQKVGRRFAAAVPAWASWSPSTGWAVVTGLCLTLGLLGMHRPKFFIYFQF